MAELVIAPATEVVKCIAEPIKRQFNYLCCFNTNIQNLRDEAKKLGDVKDGVDGQVEAERRNVQVIVRRVETWQDDVSKMQADMSGVEAEIQNVLKSGCLAIIPRFSLSRKATKMAADMKKLQDDCGKFGQICHPPPPAAEASIPPGQVYELKSRKDFEEDVMATLREKKVRLMGLYGMGGVGKTTMAKKIKSRAKEEGLFDEIVMVVVSQPVNVGEMLRIQKEMSELLGLKLEDESLQARAHLLCTRLSTKKSTLIILDDLWKKLSLEDLGIPKECTILLTSRDRDVFRAMNVDKTFQVETLDKEEAWCLFKEKVGACADDQIAEEIVRKCQGLPIAIVTVGGALKDKMHISIWKDALHDLRSSNPQDIPDFLAQVYNPLKLSYDLLPSKHAKSIFLLCCLFPEDHDILISDLCLCAWGLGIFEGIRHLQDARNKMQTSIGMHKSRSLLLDGSNESYVKMHDVIRDVAIFIAANEGLMLAREESNNTIDCRWISLFGADILTLPEESVAPNLRFLLIERPSYNVKRLSENLFERTRKLSVLYIHDYGMRSLPHTIQLLKYMRTLILYYCDSLEDISVVGELVSLEILRCQFCSWVEELPVEIGRLNQLKLLDISHCGRLETIKAGVISKLIRLEELTLFKSFKYWELAVEEGKNAAVCELNFLSSLTALKIEIEDASLAAVQIHLPNLVEFYITLGNYFHPFEDLMKTSYRRQMRLELKRDVIIGDWIHQLLRTTEYLFLTGKGSSKLLPLLPHFQSLKELHIDNVKFERTTAVFPFLESLRLKYNDGNEVERTEAAFGKMEVLNVKNCDSIKSLFSPSIVGNLVNLRELIIENCCEMVKLIEDKDNNEVEGSPLINLEKLKLKKLPKLKNFCDWECALQFPSLIQLHISSCPLMERFPLFSDSFKDLESIKIKSCLMLEQVILWNEEEGGNDINRCFTFPKLAELYLHNLPRLTSLCKGIQSIEFPLLIVMLIENCQNMKSLVTTAENETTCAGANNGDNSMHLFCKLKVAFGMLELLLIDGYDNISSEKSLSLWCDQIPFSFFSGLKALYVKNCGNTKSLFSPSIAENLVNLRQLFIESCGEMVKVIEGDEDKSSLFIKLEELELIKLPKLKIFCDWRGALQLPSLRKVVISKCPEMKRVSFGSLTTPKVEKLTIDNEDITDYTKDLNDALLRFPSP